MTSDAYCWFYGIFLLMFDSASSRCRYACRSDTWLGQVCGHPNDYPVLAYWSNRKLEGGKEPENFRQLLETGNTHLHRGWSPKPAVHSRAASINSVCFAVRKGLWQSPLVQEIPPICVIEEAAQIFWNRKSTS